MHIQTPVKRKLFASALRTLVLGVFVAFIGIFTTAILPASHLTQNLQPSAAALTSNTINFQARLMNSSGALIADGTYNVDFKLYRSLSANASAQGTCTGTSDDCLWEETRTSANQVTVKNGYVTVNLGSVTAFPTNINWDQQLYLTINVGGTAATPSWDGEMTPRLALTAIPYAFKAGQLAQYNSSTGFTSTLGLAQPTVGNQTFQIQDQGAAGTYNLCIQGSSACGFATGSATSYVQNTATLQSGTTNFNISGTGIAGTLQATTLVGSALNATSSGGTITTNAGTIQRTASGSTVIDLNDAGTTTLVVKNSGTGVANLDLYGGSLQTGSTPVTRLDNSGNLLNIGTIGASGAITGGTYNGQTISSAASFTGTLSVSGAVTLNTQASATNQAVAAGRTISAGTGLSGGGDLTANRSLSLDYSQVGRALSKTITVPSSVTSGTYYDLYSINRAEPSTSFYVTLSLAGSGNGSTRTYLVPANYNADGNCGSGSCGGGSNWVEVAALSSSTRNGASGDPLDLLVNINAQTINFRALLPGVNSGLSSGGAVLYVGISEPSNDTLSNGTVTNLATSGTMVTPTTYLPVALAATGGAVGIGTVNPLSGAELDVQGGNINTSGSIMTNGTSRITSSGTLQNVTADTGILTTGTLSVTRGGTGVDGSSASNGTLLIGNGTGYSLATLTQGSGISITNSAGGITIAATSAAGAASGDLTGTYPSPTIAKLQGSTLTLNTPASGNILQFNGTAWVNQSVSGAITISSTGVATLGSGVVSNTNLASGSYANITGVGTLGSLAVTGTVTGGTYNGQTISSAASFTGTLAASGAISSSSTVSGTQLISSATQGTAPLQVASSTLVSNLNSQYVNGVSENVLAQNLRSGYSMTGGDGATFVTGSPGSFGWVSRFLTVGNGNGSDSSSDGYFDMTMPANGTVITGAGGASNRTVANGAIPLSPWESLYYILPNGTSNATVNANYRVTSYSATLQVPSNWVLIATYNGDNNTLRLGTGQTLTNGQSITNGSINNANFATSVNTASLQTSGTTRITSTGLLQNVSADVGILTTGTLAVARGGTGVNGSTAGNGTLLIGNGSGYSLATLTQGSGISITNSAGGITIAATSAAGSASGDLTGSYPAPTIAQLQGSTLTLSTPTSGNILQFNGTAWVNQSVSGDVTISSTGVAAIGSGKVTSTSILDGTIANADLSSGSFTNITGVGTLGSLTVSGAISGGSTITGTTLNGTTGVNTGSGSGTQRIDASGNLTNIGNISAVGALSVQAASGSTSPVILAKANATPSTADIFDAQDGSGNLLASIDSAGNILTNSAFAVSGNVGLAQTSCSGSQSLKNITVSGGIITSGTCALVSGTLQNAYDNSTTVNTGSTANIPTLVGQANKVVNAGGGYGTVSYASNCTTTASCIGHIMVMTETQASGSGNYITSMTDSAGNTWNKVATAYSSSGGNSHGEMWYTLNFVPVSSVTVNLLNATYLGFTVSEYNNVSAFNNFGSVGNPSSTVATSPALSVATAGSLVVAMDSYYNTSSTVTDPTSPWTNLANNDGAGPCTSASCQRLRTAYEVSGLGTAQTSWTLPTSTANSSIIASFSPTYTSNSGSMAQILLAGNKDLHFTSVDNGASSANFAIDLNCTSSCGSNGSFKVNGSNGAPVLQVTSAGRTTFKTTAGNDSATAFQIQNASGVAFMSADSINQIITTKDLNIGGVTNSSSSLRYFSDGFESGDGTAWQLSSGSQGAVSISGPVTYDTATVRNGSYSAKFATSSSTAYMQDNVMQNNTLYGRTYFDVTSLGNPTPLMDFGTNAIGITGNHLYISLDASGYLCFHQTLGAGTASACSTTAPSTATWHKLETEVVINGTSSTLQVWLDGSLVTSNSNAISRTANIDFGTKSLSNFALGSNVASSATVYFDDVAVDDVPTGDSSSLSVSDTLHVGGTSTFTDNSTFYGSVTSNGGFSSGQAAGTSLSCGGNQSIKSTVVSGGIITGGVCAVVSGSLQNAYDNSSAAGAGSTPDTPTLVGQAGSECDTSCAATQAISYTSVGTSAATGNLMVITVTLKAGGGNSITGITDSAGNTWTRITSAYADANDRIEVWYAMNYSPVSSITLTKSSSTLKIAATVSEYNHIASLSTYASAGTTSTTGTSAPTPSLSVPDANSLVVAGVEFWNLGGATSTGPGSPWVSLTDQNVPAGLQLRSAYQSPTAAGTTQATYTLSTAGSSSGAIVAFKPTTSGTTSTIAQILMSGSKDLVVGTSSGVAALTVKSDGTAVKIGTTSSGTLLQLSGTASDPSGANGSMYYSTTKNAFRCYENGVWKNCLNGTEDTASSILGATGYGVSKSAAATIEITPMYLAGQTTVNEMRTVITTALGAAGDIGIYDASGNLVLNGGSSSVSTTATVKTVAPVQTGSARVLEAGQYYAAITWNSTTGSLNGTSVGIAGLVKRGGTISTGGGLVLPSSISLSSITPAATFATIVVNN